MEDPSSPEAVIDSLRVCVAQLVRMNASIPAAHLQAAIDHACAQFGIQLDQCANGGCCIASTLDATATKMPTSSMPGTYSP